MSDEKKNVRAAWDDAAAQVVKETGVSPSVAKALLAMNPALRDQGLDTMKLVRQSQDAAASKAPAGGAKPAKPADKSDGIYAVLQGMDKDLQRRDAELKAEITRLEAERKRLAEASRQELSKWLVAHDPDILSPVTQGALKDFQALVTAIGFKTADYIAQFRKKPR